MRWVAEVLYQNSPQHLGHSHEGCVQSQIPWVRVNVPQCLRFLILITSKYDPWTVTFRFFFLPHYNLGIWVSLWKYLQVLCFDPEAAYFALQEQWWKTRTLNSLSQLLATPVSSVIEGWKKNYYWKGPCQQTISFLNFIYLGYTRIGYGS